MDKTPTKSTPKAKAGLGIQFGPVGVKSGISLGNLQIKVDASVASPIVDAIPAVIPPIEVPIIETPPAEQIIEEPTVPTPTDVSSQVDTLLVTTDETAQP